MKSSEMTNCQWWWSVFLPSPEQLSRQRHTRGRSSIVVDVLWGLHLTDGASMWRSSTGNLNTLIGSSQTVSVSQPAGSEGCNTSGTHLHNKSVISTHINYDSWILQFVFTLTLKLCIKTLSSLRFSFSFTVSVWQLLLFLISSRESSLCSSSNKTSRTMRRKLAKYLKYFSERTAINVLKCLVLCPRQPLFSVHAFLIHIRVFKSI